MVKIKAWIKLSFLKVYLQFFCFFWWHFSDVITPEIDWRTTGLMWPLTSSSPLVVCCTILLKFISFTSFVIVMILFVFCWFSNEQKTECYNMLWYFKQQLDSSSLGQSMSCFHIILSLSTKLHNASQRKMVFLFWSAYKEPWLHPHPFFHHICQPGSTRFDSAQRKRWWKSKSMRPALTRCSQIVPVEKQHMSQTQDQCWTSLKLLCLNGNKSLQQVRHAVERLIPEERRLTH